MSGCASGGRDEEARTGGSADVFTAMRSLLADLWHAESARPAGLESVPLTKNAVSGQSVWPAKPRLRQPTPRIALARSPLRYARAAPAHFAIAYSLPTCGRNSPPARRLTELSRL
jgi:hypothetical protein